MRGTLSVFRVCFHGYLSWSSGLSIQIMQISSHIWGSHVSLSKALDFIYERTGKDCVDWRGNSGGGVLCLYALRCVTWKQEIVLKWKLMKTRPILCKNNTCTSSSESHLTKTDLCFTQLPSCHGLYPHQTRLTFSSEYSSQLSDTVEVFFPRHLYMF